jgi:hypothetical protein
MLAAGFTKMASSISPVELMSILNAVYYRFDELVEAEGLWKVETVSWPLSLYRFYVFATSFYSLC